MKFKYCKWAKIAFRLYGRVWVVCNSSMGKYWHI